jgi:ubiquinone/menaquinone biosynthesis C-methylase UbiE
MNNITSSDKNWVSKIRELFSINKLQNCQKLDTYTKSIDVYNAAQSNYEMLDAIRQYNHTIIKALDNIRPLQGLRILDIGASPHGYALEKVLALGAKEYVGIGLDINEDFYLETKTAHATLTYMNAESLSFNDNEFDAIVTMSTFEHIGNLDKALSEFHRVLKQGGCVLISFEPLWTCSYGHHLHHLGEISKLVPDWAHLLWSKNEMMEYLYTCWPENAPLSVEEAGEWIYDGDCLNRKSILEVRKTLADCQLHMEWIVPMIDESRNEDQLTAAIEKTGYTRDDLMAKGLSILLIKK